MTPLRAEEHVATYVAENGGLLLDIHGLADPNGDRLLGWDDSANDTILFTMGTGLTFSTTTLNVDTASATVQGIVELAIDAEVTTGTDTARAVTPAGLQQLKASETQDGIIELASDAETITGSATDRALTPANLQAMTASATRDGIVELATDAELITGTDTARAVTAANVNAVFLSAQFLSGSTTVTNQSAGWTPSAADSGTGITTVTHGLGTADYNVVVCAADATAAQNVACVSAKGGTTFVITAMAATNGAKIDDIDMDVIVMLH